MHIAVAGLGLIGGSICRAAKKKIPGIIISAVDADTSSTENALRLGVIDHALLPGELLSCVCDIVVVALPVKASVKVIESLLKNNPSGALVLDAGSVKGGVISSLSKDTPLEKFVPCHPMAGSEKSGFLASSASLFEKANVIITPHDKNIEQDVVRASDFWKSLGAAVILSSPEYHDAAVAFTSHMPHIMSSAVALSASDFFAEHHPEGEVSDGRFAFTGKGFLDVTRLASGSPDVWRDICELNRTGIVKALDSVIGKLENARDRLSSGGIRAFFEESVSAKRGFEMRSIVVAVDGPAGSGKSSVSKEVAQKEGLFYIDSGAIYRSITWFMLNRFMSLERNADYGSIARKEMLISQEYLPTGVSRTFVNGEDVSELIRNEKITANIGIISDNKGVRDFVTDLLRKWAGEKPVIMDGRDIGTVVFPNADVKIYCDASTRVRAERRVNEYREKGKNVDVKEVESQIIQRDDQDRSREFGALKVAEGAVILDTSELTKDQVIERFLDVIRKKRGA
jgi:CMP/dCMP kinase